MIESYSRLPLGDYIDICRISQDETREDIDKQVEILAILSGCTTDDILALPIGEYTRRADKARFLQEPAPDCGRMAKTYICGPFTLVPTKDLREITASQFIDYDTFTKAGMDEHLAEIVSVFLIPKGCRYGDGYDIAEVQQAVRNDLMVSDVLAISAFFFERYIALLRCSLSSSRRALKRVKDEKARKDLEARITEAETRLTSAGAGYTT